MPGIKISSLPAVASAQLTDSLPVVQGGATRKETIQNVLDVIETNISINQTQVSDLVNDLADKLNLSGGTMTGFLTLVADPVSALQAATKNYVDNSIDDLNLHQSCRVATTANLTATYNNGSSGVGATLTNSGAMAALSIDGVTVSLSDRVLVKNQSTQFQNGIYVVSDVGSGATNWILTRSTDFDTAAEMDNGDSFTVTSGTVNAKTQWLQTQVIATIGVDNVVFESNIVAGTGITKTNNTISVTTPIVAFSVTCDQADLAAGGEVILYNSSGSEQYRIIALFINSGGTNFSGGGGDRLGQVTDGTTVYSVIPAADLQTLTNNGWGDTALPYPASAAINTQTAAGADLVFSYSGGTTDYTAGSVVISGFMQKTA